MLAKLKLKLFIKSLSYSLLLLSKELEINLAYLGGNSIYLGCAFNLVICSSLIVFLSQFK